MGKPFAAGTLGGTRRAPGTPARRKLESIALTVAALSIGACGGAPDADAIAPTLSVTLIDSTQSVRYDADSGSSVFATTDATFRAELQVNDEEGLQTITLIGEGAALRNDSTTYVFEHDAPSVTADRLRWRGSRDPPVASVSTSVEVAFRPSTTGLLLRLEAADWAANSSTTPSIRVDLRTGGIEGTVRDAEGAVLPAVTVTIRGAALSDGPRVTISDAAGEYRFADLPAGTYTVTYDLIGFTPHRREGIEVLADRTTRLDAELSVAALEEHP